MRLELAEDLIEKGLHGRVEEAQGMRQQRSPGTGRRYPLTMICATYRLARSSVYAGPSAAPREPTGKRGPKTVISDAELVTEIRAVLAACPFMGRAIARCGRGSPTAATPRAASACCA